MILAANGVQLRIKGKVQGVGFRPYVWQIAQRLELKGDVCNDAEGVLIRIAMCAVTDGHLAEFIAGLHQYCPPLAKIDQIETHDFSWAELPVDFSIRHSEGGHMETHITPDAATCPQCLTELFSPEDRRYRYPFINCTHCGPRFTIIHQMPYDRPYTSMAKFPLCAFCQAEYDSPANRRFHAQPNACPNCGPQIELVSANQLHVLTATATDAAALSGAIQALNKGEVVAIKGIGGFHLACDATNEQAVALLRQRKQRPGKPFAVMLPSIEWLAELDERAVKLLTSPAAPIVLIDKSRCLSLSDAIAPGLSEIGVMLPANPLQHLLLSAMGKPLVMTSGNSSGKPPALSNAEAMADLATVTDHWLLHDRDIVQRADDSVVRFDGQQVETLRRARGYVPDALLLPASFSQSPSVFAAGGDLKNTFCLLRQRHAVMSQHLGDLSDIDVSQQSERLRQLFQQIYQFTPQLIVVDAHSGYASHRSGRELAERLNLPLIKVLHHHAHIAACLAEKGWSQDQGKVIGLTLDGLGMGADNALWGGECLLADYRDCQHLGGLPAVALPGGDRAALQPWRNLLAQMLRFVPDWRESPEAGYILEQPWSTLAMAIEKQINSPLASSCGRLFDAVAAALGICAGKISWEGEAACRLEALAQQSKVSRHPVVMPLIAMPLIDMPLVGMTLDLSTFWRQWLAYKADPAERAHAFHTALAGGFADLARRAAVEYGINTIVLSGGVMHNQLLRRLLLDELNDFQVLYASELPMGDGGLALGQAVIAAEQVKLRKDSD